MKFNDADLWNGHCLEKVLTGFLKITKANQRNHYPPITLSHRPNNLTYCTVNCR